MNETKIRGRIHLIEATKTFGQKGFRKRLVVLEQDNGRFVNYIPLDFIGDACDPVDDVNVGDENRSEYSPEWPKMATRPTKRSQILLERRRATGYKLLTGNAPASVATPSSYGNTTGANDALSEAAYDDGNDIPF